MLNDENCDSFKEAVLSAVTEKLLHIIKEITPLILEKSKVIIEENASSLFKSYESKSNENLKKNVDDFIHENQDLWHSKLDRCKDVMSKYLRCNKQLLLYNECLEEEPMYMHRKLRNDKVYTMNDQEKNIYNKLALEKLKAEMDILTNRREHFRNSIDTIDKKFKQFLDNKRIPEILRMQQFINCNNQFSKIWKYNRTEKSDTPSIFKNLEIKWSKVS